MKFRAEKPELRKHVERLVAKAVEASNSEDALRFAQAALNAANALVALGLKLVLVAALVLAGGCSSAPAPETFDKISAALRLAAAGSADAANVLAQHAANEAASGNAAAAAEVGAAGAKVAAVSQIANDGAVDVDLLKALVTGSPAPASK